MNVYKQKFEISASRKDIISDYEFLPSILNDFTVGTEEYYPKYYEVDNVKGL